MSREEFCYSCKRFWDCKRPCKKVEESLPDPNPRSDKTYLVKNPTKEELILMRKRTIKMMLSWGYSEITISDFFNCSRRTIYSYLHYGVEKKHHV